MQIGKRQAKRKIFFKTILARGIKEIYIYIYIYIYREREREIYIYI